jgi:hypothetical protein
MNQHDYVKECLEFYEEGGWSPEKGWEQAHYPAPENKGDATIWMLHDHHQVQGLWQSKEYDQCCFFIGDAKRFLTEGPFVSGWFELWDIYDKYSGEHCKKSGRKGGTKSAELGIGVHGRSAEQMAEGGRKGGTKSAELGIGVHGRSAEQMAEDGRKGGRKGGTKSAELGVGVHAPGKRSDAAKTTNSQKWMCLETGHISTPGGLSRWQKARGIDVAMRRRIS